MTDYLTVAEVLGMHAERSGGSHGIRDPGLLEAALFRPQTSYYADLIEEAAAWWESMPQSHPFIDGNKTNGLCSHLYISRYQWRSANRRRSRDV